MSYRCTAVLCSCGIARLYTSDPSRQSQCTRFRSPAKTYRSHHMQRSQSHCTDHSSRTPSPPQCPYIPLRTPQSHQMSASCPAASPQLRSQSCQALCTRQPRSAGLCQHFRSQRMWCCTAQSGSLWPLCCRTSMHQSSRQPCILPRCLYTP